ncbi:MAG: SusC/RagA family TonB-linked outer membrane protein [Ferruginibacter sp.]
MRKLLILMLFSSILLLQSIRLIAQEKTISGLVTNDADNTPLKSVTVIVKGTQTATTTNNLGYYSIAAKKGDILVFTSVGQIAQEILIGNQAEVNIHMLPQQKQLEEVIVSTAFGIKARKKTLGYNVQEVSASELSKGKENSFINALQGKVNGVNIVSSGGSPGAGTDIVIRGISSLSPTANNQPLIVIDGLPIDNRTINGSVLPSTGSNGNQAGSADQFGTPNRGLDINPDDIESITVLKGAGATALYGLSAANGAIIITTKKGSTGRVNVSFNTSAAIDYLTKFPEIQTKYREGSNGRIGINANGSLSTAFQTFGPLITNETVYRNFVNAFDRGARYNNSLTIQGGNAKTTYYSSVSALNQTGIVPSTKYDRYTFKLAGTSQLSTKFSVNGSATFTTSNTVAPSAGDKGIMTALVYHTTTVDVRDYINPDGTMKVYSPGIIDNPIYVAKFSQQKSSLGRMLGNVGFSYNIIPKLRFDYKIGADFYSDNRTRVVPGPAFPGAQALDLAGATGGFIAENRINFKNISSNAFLTWTDNINKDFNYSFLLGNSLQTDYTDIISARGEGFSLPNFYDLSNTANLFNTDQTTRRRYAGVFGDLKFGIKNSLFIELTARNDWSSTLPVQNNSFFYPSGSLSYVFTEQLHVPKNILSYGKIRLSYAAVGKDAPIGTGGTYYYSATGFPFNGIPGSRRGVTFYDPNLLPEKQKSYEVGTELHFINDRLNVDVSLYKSKNADQIISVPISYNSGYSNFVTNAGSIQNKGIEVQLDAIPLRTKDFRWNVTLNWSKNVSKVLSIKEGITSIPFYQEGRITNKLIVGGSAGDLFGIKYKRDAGGQLIILPSGFPDITATSENQWVKVGNSTPDWLGSINNSITYKNFTLSALLEIRQGGDMFDVTMRNGIRNGVLKITENRYQQIIFKGVHADGTPNTTPVILDENYYRNANLFNNIADVIVQDASWVRLRNVTLGYAIPEKIVSRLGFVKSLNVSFTGSNFILHTPFVGYDPESSAYGAGANVYGFTGSNIPNYSSFIFSLNANF